MTRYRIEMAQGVGDLVPHLPPELKRKVKAAFRSIALRPRSGQAHDPYRGKELKDELAGLRSYPIARARIIYRISSAIVEVIAFGPRADIYERAATELSKASRKDKAESTRLRPQRDTRAKRSRIASAPSFRIPHRASLPLPRLTS